ncbi:MAG: recombination mediator RecR [Patescibacteria group bacterium]
MNLDQLIEHFLKFPGIGPRQAKRFAYFLAGENEDFVKNLARLILEVKNQTRQCESCWRFFETPNSSTSLCSICSNLNRDASSLMVVEKDVDLDNIERTGAYNGKYFVLGGTIPLTGNNKNNLRLKELFEIVKKEKIKEVILATSTTLEGENTNRYVEKILSPLKTKTTRLGRGLSTGAELEYSDSETIANALKNRK